jgi:hypothetical protein
MAIVPTVIPAKAGIQGHDHRVRGMDSRLRGNDDVAGFGVA